MVTADSTNRPVKSVQVLPVHEPLRGEVRVPHSKPHMQRTLLLSLLTNAPTIILNPAWSSEARDLYDAVQGFGLVVEHEEPARLVVSGTGRSLNRPAGPLLSAGSAFNFRTAAALACLVPGETVLEGNASMRKRPVTQYLNFVNDLGGRIEEISDDNHLRVRVHGARRYGGETTIDTRHSSQPLTAALLVAPLADFPVRIHCDDSSPVGEGYVDLTVDMMRGHGAVVDREDHTFTVQPSVYRSRAHLIASDFTALSYVAGAVAVSPEADVSVLDYEPSLLSSEEEFFAVLRSLGVGTSYDPVTHLLRLYKTDPDPGTIEIDGRNIPTVVPTLAAIAPYVDATVTVRNVAHVNNHKCPRVSVMLAELHRLGCRIEPIRRGDGLVDGFTTSGRQSPAGGVPLASHGDHRIFMSLATAALGAQAPTVVEGAQHLAASFPDYLPAMAQLGVGWNAVEPGFRPDPFASTAMTSGR